MSPVLVKEAKYQGKYVAMVSLSDTRIVACDKDPFRVIVKAEGKGHPDAVVVFVDTIETARTHCAHS